MKILSKRALLSATAVALAAAGYAAPAAAQLTRTWVSGVGDDANPCSRTAPCKTFAGSIPKTASGGEINCLDPAGYGAVTITKSISIVCDYTLGSVLVSGSNGITVNGAGISVVLSGLDLEGVGNTGSPGINGIRFLQGASLVVDNVKIRGFRGGYGISFEPTTTGSTLVVRNAIVTDNGSSSNALTGGIQVKPATGLTASANIADSQIANNLNVGVRIETTGTATISAVVTNSGVTNSASGLLFRAPTGGTINGTVDGATLSQNGSYALIANGAATNVRVGNTTIANNNTGIFTIAGATVTSFGDNKLTGNTSNGAFTTTTLKQ